MARYAIPSAPAGGFIQDPGWLGSKFDTYLWVSKPCLQLTRANATHQKRLPNFEVSPVSPFLKNEAHHVPHCDLCRPVRGLAVGTCVPGDNDPKVLHVSWRIEGLDNFERSINFVLGKSGVERTYVKLGFNFVPCLLLLPYYVLSYGFGEPPRVFSRYTRKHVESFALGVR